MRNHNHLIGTLVVSLVLALVFVAPVAAQEVEPEPEILPCEGESVTGTVVGVEDDVVTLDTGEGLCTVSIAGDYEHPIVAVMGAYFGETSADDLAEAVAGTQGCAVYDADTDTWAWADCEDEGAVAVTIVGENEDGSFSFTATVEDENGDPVEVTGDVTIDDPDAAEALNGALGTLAVEWTLTEEGSVSQAGDDIAAYHEDGVGFGVLVKLYAMAAESAEACAADESGEPCEALSVDDLVAALEGGAEMGDLYEEYGKPSALGVGHVKNKDKNRGGPPDHAGEGDDEGDGEGGPPDHAKNKTKKDKNPNRPAHAGPKNR
jgi:hypothetical protein